ncbi:MAG TPA: hypothetical protein EYG18_02785 [Micavibrio sp.]|nr:hypothetical protein [Micavibrio sp.]HIL28173.1 hypothetical protein [Micavibrio sp.]
MPAGVDNQEHIDAVIKSEKLGKRLCSRYSLALGLVACVLFMTYFTMTIQLGNNQADARQINISGMQRMLSQRIAMLALEVSNPLKSDDPLELSHKMQDAIELMQSNHKELIDHHTDSPMSPEIRELYYGADGVDKLVMAYTNIATRYLVTFRSHGSEAVMASPALTDIVEMANNVMLGPLNAVVYRYQEEAEQKVQRFKLLETVFLCLGLVTLTLELLFIFRPMARDIVSKTKSLEQSNAELIEFSYRISHDLRAPVVSSFGLAETAEKSIRQDDTRVAFTSLGYIKDAMIKLDALIDDIINLTRMKMSDLMFEEVDIEKSVSEALEKMKALQNYDKINIAVEIKGGQTIKTAKIYFQQSLENLISNAIKYADVETIEPKIEISITLADKKCKVLVTDNGLGIEEKFHPKLFKMFERFHTNVSFGSGLGLYLVKQNVGILDGKVHFVALDKGSEFGFEIPIKATS